MTLPTVESQRLHTCSDIGFGDLGEPPDAATASVIEALFLLVMGHFVGDFALQSDRMAVEKCPGKDQTLAWQWWLTAHAAIHGFLVAVLSGVVWLGMFEWLLHALIDLGKCRHRYGLGVDQGLHLFCKLIWAVLLVKFGMLNQP